MGFIVGSVFGSRQSYEFAAIRRTKTSLKSQTKEAPGIGAPLVASHGRRQNIRPALIWMAFMLIPTPDSEKRWTL